jgi:hypothetical protein
MFRRGAGGRPVGGVQPSSLWNERITPESYAAGPEAYQQAILEQYKLFAEMADRTSNRRGLANTFFLTFNTAAISTLAGLLAGRNVYTGWLLIPLAALLIECLAWFALIRSYRLLNSAKFAVICAMEEQLPAMPWTMEWYRIGFNSGTNRYRRITLIERWVPITFSVAYLAGFIAYALR